MATPEAALAGLQVMGLGLHFQSTRSALFLGEDGRRHHRDFALAAGLAAATRVVDCCCCMLLQWQLQ